MKQTASKLLKKNYGIVVPAITPLTADGRYDASAMEKIIHHLQAGGVHGIFIQGTTGEGLYLSPSVRREMVQDCKRCVSDSTQLYVGITHMRLEDTIDFGQFCCKQGVDTVVVHQPFPYPVTESEMRRWFLQIIENVASDIMLYNMPILCHTNMPYALVEELSQHPNVVGIKDSNSDFERLKVLVDLFRERPDFVVLSGVSKLMGVGTTYGMDGNVPSTANLNPRLCVDLFNAAQTGDHSRVVELEEKLNEIIAKVQSGTYLTNSIARLKKAMECLGLCTSTMGGFMQEVDAVTASSIRQELKNCGMGENA